MKIANALLLLTVLGTPSLAADIETKFLILGDSTFSDDFEDGKNPGKPNWQLRKSAWEVEDGVLRGRNVDSNGLFIRLHSKEKGGVLPEDYIMKFSNVWMPRNARTSTIPLRARGTASALGITPPSTNGDRISAWT